MNQSEELIYLGALVNEQLAKTYEDTWGIAIVVDPHPSYTLYGVIKMEGVTTVSGWVMTLRNNPAKIIAKLKRALSDPDELESLRQPKIKF